MEKRPHSHSAPLVGAILAFTLLLLVPAFAWAAKFSLTSDTLFRFFERNDDLVAPAYEYLQADAGALEGKGLSLHFYGWGRADLADSNYYSDNTAGEFLYGYLEYTRDLNNLSLKVGRQYVFEGVANDSVDGARVAVDVTPYFSLSAYGGQPVALDSEQGRSGDSIVGGRIGHHLGSLYEVGVSYKLVNNDGSEQEQMLGADLNATLPFGVGLSGFSSYNLRTDGWGEHSYELRFNIADFHFRPFFEYFRYKDYFGTGVNSASPFTLLAATDEKLTTYGTDIIWQKYAKWDIGAKFKGFSYDDSSQDSSFYYAGLLTWHGQGLTQVGGELGYMDGDPAQNSYFLTRAYFYCDQVGKVLPFKFVTGDVVYAYYDEAIYNENNALFLSLGVGSNFLKDALQIKLSGDYSSDPYFNSDLRGLLTARYSFDM